MSGMRIPGTQGIGTGTFDVNIDDGTLGRFVSQMAGAVGALHAHEAAAPAYEPNDDLRNICAIIDLPKDELVAALKKLGFDETLADLAKNILFPHSGSVASLYRHEADVLLHLVAYPPEDAEGTGFRIAVHAEPDYDPSRAKGFPGASTAGHVFMAVARTSQDIGSAGVASGWIPASLAAFIEPGVKFVQGFAPDQIDALEKAWNTLPHADYEEGARRFRELLQGQDSPDELKTVVDFVSESGPGEESQWLARLGVTDAPMTRNGVKTALRFFRTRMPELTEKTVQSFLKGMDLHSPVSEELLQPPTNLAAFRKNTEDPLRLFYTKVGTSLQDLGVNPQGRLFRRFEVAKPVSALRSRCGSAKDTWTDDKAAYIANGGGQQYIVPNARDVLKIVG